MGCEIKSMFNVLQVTKNDVISAMCFYINRMVSFAWSIALM